MTVAALEQIDPHPYAFSADQLARASAAGWLQAGSIGMHDHDRNGNGVPACGWTLAEYYQMAEWGWFEQMRVMLIDGEILRMATQKSPHFLALDATGDVLRAVFGPGYWVRLQAPLELNDLTDAEPDVAVVKGSRLDYRQGHPRSALLVVESSDTTLSYDRGPKGSLYARAQIADYWILNVVARELEVFRNPVVDETALYGYRYAERQVLRPGDTIAPLAKPDAAIAVAGLFE